MEKEMVYRGVLHSDMSTQSQNCGARRVAAAREQLCKQALATSDTYGTTEEPLKAVFSMQFMLRLYTWD
jgi:hypothetical protein